MPDLPITGPTASCGGLADTGNPVTNGNNLSCQLHFMTGGPNGTGVACGNTFVLQAGATYTPIGMGPGGQNSFTGWISCPANNPITIQSSKSPNLNPGVRVSYASIPNMATLQGCNLTPGGANGGGGGDPTWVYNLAAGGYTFIGLLFQSGDGTVGIFDQAEVVMHNYLDSGVAANAVHNNTYDRCIIRPFEESLANPDSVSYRSAALGLRLDGDHHTLKNSVIDGFCCSTVPGFAPFQIHQSQCIVWSIGTNHLITNNLLGAYYSNIFNGGSHSDGLNNATLSASSLGPPASATLSNITNLQVGNAIRFFYAATFPTCNPPNANMNFASGIVQTINAATNQITWTWLTASGQPNPPSTAPDVPGQASWNGPNTTNITVTRNTLNKRAAWIGNSGQCKSYWEWKDLNNSLIEGNIYTGPVDTTAGKACPISVAQAVNQDGSNPWAATNNNIIRNNLMIGVGLLFAQMPHHNFGAGAGCPIQPATGTLTFTNNLLGGKTNRDHMFVNAEGGPFTLPYSWTITHNTVVKCNFGDGAYIINNTNFGDATNHTADVNNITFRDNVVWSGGSTPSGNGGWFAVFPGQFPGFVSDHNMYQDMNGCASTPANCHGFVPGTGDLLEPTETALGLVNMADCFAINPDGTGGDYHSCGLAVTSPGHNAASDHTNIGVNLAQLDAAIGSSYLNDPVTMHVNFNVPDNSNFLLFASDLNANTEFLVGGLITANLTLSDGSVQAVTVSAPVLSPPLSPNTTSVIAPVTCTITGSHFSVATVVFWDGVIQPTNIVSSTSMTFPVVGSLLTAGTHSVTARTPGSPLSNSLTFTVTGPPPPLQNTGIFVSSVM